MVKRSASDEAPTAKRVSTKKVLNQLDDYTHRYISVRPLDVFVWGTGSMCELGLGPLAKNKEVKRPRLNPFLPQDKVGIVSIAVGGMHTLALDKDNNIWSWGCNDYGALGRDTSGAKEKLKDANDSSDDEDGDLNELESTPTKLPFKFEGTSEKDAKIVQLVATDNLSSVLLSDGTIYAWGTFRCNEGILGFYQDKIEVQREPWVVPKFAKGKIVQMAGGKDHILFLDEAGIGYAWGNGQQYQLGRKILDRFRLKTLYPLPFGLKKVKYIASGENHCFALTETGKVVSWGLNQFGQCGIGESIEDGGIVAVPSQVMNLPLDNDSIRTISAGEHHSLFLMESGALYTCGRIDMNEIGLLKKELPTYAYKDEHERVRAVPLPTKVVKTLEELDPEDDEDDREYKEMKFKNIAAGSHHSIAISQDGKLYTWGFGETYAVGQGPAGDDIEVPVKITNTATKEVDMVLAGSGGQFSVSAGYKQ